MKKKNYLLALFLILAGLQTSQAQILKVWQNGKFDSYDVRKVDSVQFVESFHEWVDLDLPSGTLWATCNVGAHSPEEYGDYFAWGDTKPKSEYTWSNYFDKEDGSSTFKTYNKDGGLTELLPEHDAATVNWGSEWQMPSFDQIKELYNSEYTTSEWTTQNGVNGRKITGRNNNSIFLPAAGLYDVTGLDDVDSRGYYWTRSLYTDDSYYAYYLYVASNKFSWYGNPRCYGQSVRPVRNLHVIENLKLSETQLNLELDDEKIIEATFQIEGHERTGYLSWECSNTDVVEFRVVDSWYGEETVNVKALAPGTCTITCRATYDSSVFAQCQVTVDYGYVDLGLPSGTLWAKNNICGFYPEDGEQFYFPWGMSSYVMNNGWNHYAFFEGTDESDVRVNKYCTNSGQGVNGFTDGLTELLPEDDTATMLWGDNWQMPSKAQFLELFDSRYTETEFMQHERNLYYGYKITSKTNGNSIFLRAAGYHDDERVLKGEEFGLYWLRTLDTNNNLQAEYLTFDASGFRIGQYPRYFGLSVRPVRKQ